MSEEKTVSQDKVQKALGALKSIAAGEDIAKSNGAGTVHARTPAMTAESGATQIHHTPSDSSVSSWAGTTLSEVAGNGASVDPVEANGTDYKNNGSAVVKSVLSLLASGKISQEAAAVLLEKALPFEKKDDEDKEDDKEVKKGQDKDEEDDMEKSIASNATLNEGFEVSSFLREQTLVLAKGISALAAEVKAVRAELAAVNTKNVDFQKSLAGAVVSLGEGIVAQSQRVDSISQAPARAAKSVQVIEKSFGNDQKGASLTKKDLLTSAEDLVQKGQLHYSTVLRLEAGGNIQNDEMSRIVGNISK